MHWPAIEIVTDPEGACSPLVVMLDPDLSRKVAAAFYKISQFFAVAKGQRSPGRGDSCGDHITRVDISRRHQVLADRGTGRCLDVLSPY
jgi:hypothetical protein